jgi:MFS family permease
LKEISVSCNTSAESRPRFQLSNKALSVFGVVASITFFASSSAPTPLYRLYQVHLGLSPLLLTVIFASYALSLLVALLTVGSLSDYIGRRPVAFAALLLNAVAMAMFTEAHSAAMLIAARVVQGFAAGAAITTLGAILLDTNRVHGALFNSVAPFAGLTTGAFGASALATYAPFPEHLVYAVLFIASIVEAVVLLAMPETAEKKAGALASLRPHVGVPRQARQALLRLTPANIAGWALGGFYLSLMPTLVSVATGLSAPIVGGAVVAALTFAASAAVLLLRHQAAARILTLGISLFGVGVAVTLAGVHMQSVALLLLGTVAAGFGFGAAFSGIVRTLLPLAETGERAGLLAAFYVESYLAFSLPAIGLGLLAPVLGLTVAAYAYGIAVLVLAISTLAATHLSRR